MTVMPALKRQKEFKASFGYTASLDYMRPCIKKQVTKVTRMWEKDGHTPQALWERRYSSLIQQLVVCHEQSPAWIPCSAPKCKSKTKPPNILEQLEPEHWGMRSPTCTIRLSELPMH